VDALASLIRSMNESHVQFVIMGVWGINYYARSGSTLFTTADRDFFLPPDPANLMQAWAACEAHGLELWAGQEPLDVPRDELLADRIVERRALTSALGPNGMHIDLSLVMAGFAFDEIWERRRTFKIDGVDIPVARLADIIASKAAAGREKDRLFLATHAEAIRTMQRHADTR
jgi:predicted nucleotidyltransferase